MAIAFVSGQVASFSSDASGATAVVAFPGNLTAGNCAVAAVGCANAGTVSSVVDSAGNTYGQGVTFDATNISERLDQWFKASVAGGAATVTASFSASMTFRRLGIAEFSGVATTSAQDGSGLTGQAASGTTCTTNSMLPAASGSLFVGWCNDAVVPDVGSGFTNLASYGSDSRFEYMVQATAATQNVVCTLSASNAWGIVGFVLKPASDATLEQEGYRFVNDDGNEAGSTFVAAQDTPITRDGTRVRLRIILNATGNPAQKIIGVKYSVNDAQKRTLH